MPDGNDDQPRQGIQSEQLPKDHWNQSAYKASASFVPLLTQEIVSWLNPQPSDVILDLGCGDGSLTAQIAERCRRVDGFDASLNLIQAASSAYGERSNLGWHVLDCRYLFENIGISGSGLYNKVFSNAALHWILRDASTRMSVLRGIHKALTPGGEFVFEMGGAGNVAEVHAALLSALVHQGVSIERARSACPWLFPSEKLMKSMLEAVDFHVVQTKLEYRPTRLTVESGGGLEGWVRLMGASFLEVLEEDQQREAVVREVLETLHTVLRHEEDGSMWLGYVRLKMRARK
ncbi:hypothetical protein ACLMJK_007010 [Lecanora helva]